MKLEEQIVEVCYNRMTELCKPAFFALSAAFPLAERRKHPKVNYRYEDGMQQVRFHRNHHKNVIKDNVLMFANLFRRGEYYDPGEIDKATIDFRKLVVAQFDMVYIRLKDYASLILPKDHVEGFLATLENVYPKERELLLAGIAPEGIGNYSVTPKFRKEEDFLKKV